MTDQDLKELEDRVSNALDVPEPSPLFWEHFPNRVRAAIAAGPAEKTAWWRRRAFVLAVSSSLLVVSSWALWNTTRSQTGIVDDRNMVAEGPVTGDIELLEESSGDAGWDIVSSVAASAGVETLREAGFGVAPGGAEAAIEGMNDAERAELVALLRAEIDGDEGGL